MHSAITIDLWTASLELPDAVLIDGYHSILSVPEQTRADRFLVERVRRHYIASTLHLRNVLAQYLSIPAADIAFGHGAHGKPHILSDIPAHSRIRFNISHAGDYWVMAVAMDHEVGVDIEYCASTIQPLELAERFFAPAEYQQLRNTSPAEQLTAFYKIWTLKEAFIKATGEGLFFGLDQFIVNIQRDRMDAMDCLDSIRGNRDAAQSWSLGLVPHPPEHYCIALAVHCPISVVHRFMPRRYC